MGCRATLVLDTGVGPDPLDEADRLDLLISSEASSYRAARKTLTKALRAVADKVGGADGDLLAGAADHIDKKPAYAKAGRVVLPPKYSLGRARLVYEAAYQSGKD